MKLLELSKEEFPSVKTYNPTEIAKKHNVSLDAIRKELRTGMDVELEHTKNKRQAREIALDHLWELPDYYTRLQRMEHVSEMTINAPQLPQYIVDSFIPHLEEHGKEWAIGPNGTSIIKTTHEGLDIYGLRDQKGILVSFVTFKPVKYNNQEFYQLNVLSNTTNRGGGFYAQLNLLWTIKEQIGKPIIDYGSQTSSGKRFAAALGKTGRFNIHWYNTKTGQQERYNPNDDPIQSKHRGMAMTDWRMVVENATISAFPKKGFKYPGGFVGIPFTL